MSDSTTRRVTDDPSGDMTTGWRRRVEQAYEWVLERMPTSLRSRLAIIIVLAAVAIEVTRIVARFVGITVNLGAVDYLQLGIVCWIGAGGALVPVPGVRPLSWLMIVNQGAVLFAPAVILVAAMAMVAGQSSYFLATRATTRRPSGGPLGYLRRRVSGAPSGADGPADGAAGPKATTRLPERMRQLLADGEAQVTRRMSSHPQRVLFALCVVPNPMTTFATVTAASTGLAFRRFYAASLAGFLVLSAVLVAAGQTILAVLRIG